MVGKLAFDLFLKDYVNATQTIGILTPNVPNSVVSGPIWTILISFPPKLNVPNAIVNRERCFQ